MVKYWRFTNPGVKTFLSFNHSPDLHIHSWQYGGHRWKFTIHIERLRNEGSQLIARRLNPRSQKTLLESLNSPAAKSIQIKKTITSDYSTKQIRNDKLDKSQPLRVAGEVPAIIGTSLTRSEISLQKFRGSQLSSEQLDVREKLKQSLRIETVSHPEVSPLDDSSASLTSALGFPSTANSLGRIDYGDDNAGFHSSDKYEIEKQRRARLSELRHFIERQQLHDKESFLSKNALSDRKRLIPKIGERVIWPAEKNCPTAMAERRAILKKISPIKKVSYDAKAIMRPDGRESISYVNIERLHLKLDELLPIIVKNVCCCNPKFLEDETFDLLKLGSRERGIKCVSVQNAKRFNEIFNQLISMHEQNGMIRAIYGLCRPNASLRERVSSLLDLIPQLFKSPLFSEALLCPLVEDIQSLILPQLSNSDLIEILYDEAGMKNKICQPSLLNNSHIEAMFFKLPIIEPDIGDPEMILEQDWSEEISCRRPQNDLPTNDSLYEISNKSRLIEGNAESAAAGPNDVAVMLILKEFIRSERLLRLQVDDSVRLMKWSSHILLENKSGTHHRSLNHSRYISSNAAQLKSFLGLTETADYLVYRLTSSIFELIHIKQFQAAINVECLISLLESVKEIQNCISSEFNNHALYIKAVAKSLGECAVNNSGSCSISQLFQIICCCMEVGCSDRILEALLSHLYSVLLLSRRHGLLQRRIDVLPYKDNSEALHCMKPIGEVKSTGDPEILPIDPGDELSLDPEIDDIIQFLFTSKKCNVRHPILLDFLCDSLCNRFDAHLLTPLYLYQTTLLIIALKHWHPGFLSRSLRYFAMSSNQLEKKQVNLITQAFHSLNVGNLPEHVKISI